MPLLYTRSYALSSPSLSVGCMISRCLLHLRVCEYRVEQVSCPHCQQVSQWGFPAEVNAPVQYGPNVWAWRCICTTISCRRRNTPVEPWPTCAAKLPSISRLTRELFTILRIIPFHLENSICKC